MQTYIGTIVTLISLLVVIVSMWGLGKTVHSGNDAGEKASAVFFTLGTVVFAVAMTIAIKYPSLELYCL